MSIYYLIRNASDPKIIGVKNGIFQAEIIKDKFVNKENYDELIKFFDAFRFWQKTNFDLDTQMVIEYAELLKGAILTDFLSFSPHLMACPFFVSEHVMNILASFRMPKHFLIPVKLFSNGRQVAKNYHMIYCPYLDFDKVDFSKTIFYTGNAILGKKFVKLNNEKEYREYSSKHPLLGTEKVYLNDTFDEELDFFLPRIGGMFVSRKLREHLLNERVTGITIFGDEATTCEFNC